MRRLALYLGLVSLLPLLLSVLGCAQPEKPAANSGYYDGPMTPAGGGAKAKKGGE